MAKGIIWKVGNSSPLLDHLSVTSVDYIGNNKNEASVFEAVFCKDDTRAILGACNAKIGI